MTASAATPYDPDPEAGSKPLRLLGISLSGLSGKGFEDYDPQKFVLKDVDTVREYLMTEENGHGIWLVTLPNTDSFYAGGLNSFELERAVDIFFDVECCREFNLSTVSFLRVNHLVPSPVGNMDD